MSGRKLHASLLAIQLEGLLQILRAAWPGSWSPEVTLEGQVHLDQALSRGRGAVLWIHRFRPFVHLVALGQAGFRISQASDPNHGYLSHSRFGRRYLSRVQHGVEDQYRERIVIVPGELSHLKVLASRLAENRLVGFYTNTLERMRAVSISLLGGTIELPTAAVSLARQAGAPILPVFPVGQKAGCFRVIVEAPLVLDQSYGGRHAVERAMQSHSAVLADYVRRYPEQWRGWFRFRMFPARPSPTASESPAGAARDR
jgi:lauroyl/myristoyl acyltransferase